MKKMIVLTAFLFGLIYNVFSQSVDVGTGGLQAFFSESMVYFLNSQSSLRNGTNYLGGFVRFQTDSNGNEVISWGKDIDASEVDMYTDVFFDYVQRLNMRKEKEWQYLEDANWSWTPRYEFTQAGVRMRFVIWIARNNDKTTIVASVTCISH